MNTKIIALIAIAALGLLLVTAAMTTTNVFAGVITTVITTATIVAAATARAQLSQTLVMAVQSALILAHNNKAVATEQL